MTLAAARRVADSVLYEGYLLYPYRASAAKNQVRWQFGVLGPVGTTVGEPSTQAAELLVTSEPMTTVDVLLRYLQVQSRRVEQWTSTGWRDVDELVVGDTRWVPFDEGVLHEVALSGLPVGESRALPVVVPGGDDTEELHEAGTVVGRLVRHRQALTAAVQVTARAAADPRLTVVRLDVENSTACPAPDDRDVAVRHSLVGTHLLVTAAGGAFVSLLDGPEWSRADAAACRQERCWPVLIADDDRRDAVLVAPIILGDHPRVAPESAGDLFDATEIDEILTLRVLTMTEDEKTEARGTDPKAAAILARCEEMTGDELGRLHGARRDPDPTRDAAMVGGVAVRRGSRVLLRPTRRADAQDMFLAGLTAVVARVYGDLDGETHIAVMLEDDPGSDLYATTGRFYYFHPDELEALEASA